MVNKPGETNPAPARESTKAADPRDFYLHRKMPARDVPYVPTDEPVLAAMLRFAHVTSQDRVYDLGCGDGRIVIAAARHYGAHGVGVDIDPLRIQESRENARRAGVAHQVQFVCQSFFDVDLSQATLVALYLLPAINVKLRPKLLRDLAPGTRIVANNFDMGDWSADMRADVHHRTLWQWIVPAWVGGRWRCVVNHPQGRQHMVLRLQRRFQTVTGTGRFLSRWWTVTNGRLFGEDLTFKLADDQRQRPTLRCWAQVKGNVIRGTCQEGLEGQTFAWGGRLEG